MTIMSRRAFTTAFSAALAATAVVRSDLAKSAPNEQERVIAILLFEGVTALDAVGPYELLHRLPNTRVVFVGERRGPILSDSGVLTLMADQSIDEVTKADILLVPGGGIGVRKVRENPRLIEWIKAVDQTTTYTASVCTGALILAEAGFLKGREAATHWALKGMLNDMGARYVPDRYVRSDKIWTSAGVSAGIDMTLAMIAEMDGPLEAQVQQLGIQYDPHPPYNSGSDLTASSEVMDAYNARRKPR